MIKGKSAIVTGSTSGIGLGIATALAEQGCNLLLNGFGDQGEIEKLRAGLAEKYRIKVAYSPADMSKPADIRAMVALAESALGACDILVNNAGIQFVAPVEDFPEEKWDAIIAAWPRRQRRQGRLCRGQARSRRHDQGGGDRSRQ